MRGVMFVSVLGADRCLMCWAGFGGSLRRSRNLVSLIRRPAPPPLPKQLQSYPFVRRCTLHAWLLPPRGGADWLLAVGWLLVGVTPEWVAESAEHCVFSSLNCRGTRCPYFLISIYVCVLKTKSMYTNEMMKKLDFRSGRVLAMFSSKTPKRKKYFV